MTTELPSGVVTFLFTDIEASTQQLSRLGDENYLALMERHRAVLRAAFAAHSGHEVSTGGDSFFVAFERASDAVGAALDAQSALADERLDEVGVRVRMGLHTGQALLVDGDYHGLAVHHAARIAGAAHGGQVLVSAATADLASAQLPEDLVLTDLGEHRLKDLERPQRLFQLGSSDLATTFPPPRSLELVTHNLPVQTSSFVGRHTELAEVAKLLEAARLVSLLGPGGVGKTRLAFQVAADGVENFSGGIWVAELASVADETAVAAALLRALALREEAARNPTDTIGEYLRDRQALVILDNCEQVISAAAALAKALLENCPKLRVLATSREALRVGGEVTYQVGGLGLVSGASVGSLDSPADADAVRLFVARAADVSPGFVLSADNAADIAALCARLDGLPLAIELAAARARSLSPGQIKARLGQTLDLLSKGARDADARQATLRGAIDWSHDLLGEPEQVLFRRLAVFTGGWRLEAAEHVCAGEDLPATKVLDVLDALADKSLVAVGADNDGEVRYRLLETIGAYATERLEEAGEAAMLADAHATWCSALAAEASQGLAGTREEAGWFDRLEPEQANLLASLEHLRSRGDAEELEQAGRLGAFWLARGHWQVARAQLHAALLVDSGPSPARAKVLASLGSVAADQGDYREARGRIEEALTIARDLGDRSNEGRWVGSLGTAALYQGDNREARSRYEEALTIARDVGDRRSEGRWVGSLGAVAFNQGDYPEARSRFEEALTIARDLGDRSSEGRWVGILGGIAASQGDYPEARSRFEEALTIARDLGDRRSEGTWAGNLGYVAAIQGDYREARSRFAEALTIARDVGDRRSEGRWVGGLGDVAANQGDYPEARSRYEEALTSAREIGNRRNEGFWIGNLGDVAASQGDYREARSRYEEALTIAREIGDRRAEGRWVGRLGKVAAIQGDYPESRRRLEEALTIARELDLPSLSVACIEFVAVLLGAVGSHHNATELVAWADESRRQSGSVRSKADKESADKVIVDARGALGDDALDLARKSGVALSGAEALDVAQDYLRTITAD